MAEIIWQHPGWTPGEVPKIPGGPATLEHAWPVRLRFGTIGLLCGITGSLGNALVTSNLPQIQGALSLTPVEGQWLVASYIMVNCWANLVLFKFRMQYGIRLYAKLGLSACAIIFTFQVFAQSYEAALLARAASGLAAAPLLSMAISYCIQASGQTNVPRGAMAGISTTQLGAPLAFMLVPGLNDLADAYVQYMFEAGLAVVTLALVVIYPLPFSQRQRVLGWGDAIAVGLLAPGLALLVAVICQARLQWWTDAPWLGVALAGAFALIVAGLAWEHSRPNPLLYTRWLSTGAMLFFILAAFALRFITSEQQTGTVAFLRAVATGPDQFRLLYAVVALATLAGIVIALTLGNPKTFGWLVLVGALLLLIGCLLDRDTTPQDRPHDFFVSQAIIGFASALSVGPLLMIGIGKVFREGIQYIISVVVVFSFAQNVGPQLGTALLSTYQLSRQHEHSASINAAVDPTDPLVRQRLTQESDRLAGVIVDPVLRTAQATTSLRQASSLNSGVRAYNDLFSLTALVALALAVMIAARLGWLAIAARRAGGAA